MEHYTRGNKSEQRVGTPSMLPFVVADGTTIMRVKPGSKISNLIGFAVKVFKPDEVRQIVFTGFGAGVAKVISCVEIVKRRFKNLHQLNKIDYVKSEEEWEPTTEGLEKLKVVKQIPAMHVLLSKDPLDHTEPGYQTPGSFNDFWKELVKGDVAAEEKRRKNPVRAGIEKGDASFTLSKTKREKRKRSEKQKEARAKK